MGNTSKVIIALTAIIVLGFLLFFLICGITAYKIEQLKHSQCEIEID